jgi:N-acetylmuramoyl-L-alanine amidase
MSYYRRLNQLLAVVAGVSSLSPQLALAELPLVVRSVRYSAEAGQTRVVLDLTRRSGFTVDYLADSSAISIVVPGASLDGSVHDAVVGGNGVRDIRARADEARAEIVVGVEHGVTWKEFSVPARDGKPFRIVVDLGAGAAAAEVAAAEAGSGVDADSVSSREPAAAPSSARQPASRPFVVAIDAGHGGHDTGAIGKYALVEKKLCLDLARRIAAILDRQPGVDAVLTRDSDVYLTLERRNQVAEEKHADVFVSIHLNSAPSSSARGAEIYFVAPAGAQRAASRALASGEAAHDFGLDPGDDGDIVHMLLDVNQQSVLARSELLAESILESVRDRRLLPTRTVKQKSFSVLRTITMPSVLVEAGFISNASDARLVRDAAGRETVARAVADGVLEFFRLHPPQRGAPESAVIHRVQRGDTLWTISRIYKTSVDRLRQLNSLGTRSSLRVGQELVVRTN